MAKNTKRNTPPVRLPSQIKHAHQSQFLFYINELTEEVSVELKKLTSKCENLFGEFPVPPNTITDFKNFGVWVFEPRDESQRRLWWHIGKVFRECIWKESRDTVGSFNWFPILRENDNQLKQIFDYEEEIKKQ